MNRLNLLADYISQPNRQLKLESVYIVAAKRTPIGSYMGKLSDIKAPQLAAICIKQSLKSIKLSPQDVNQVILGNVLSAGVGQAPARQAAIFGGLNVNTVCTTINKVCASGIKSIALGCQSIELGNSEVVIAGGFESMSNAPHIVLNARKGVGMGDKKLIDSLTYDGLTDPYKNISMGLCAEKTAKQMNITRSQQDNYCKMTYIRHIQATKNKILQGEIVPIQIKTKQSKQIISTDQQASRYKQKMIQKLSPAFDKKGTITSANASKINDGACCLVLMSEKKMKHLNVKPLGKIIAYADSEIEPIDFCKSPYYSTVKALKKAGLKIEDIDLFEYNEAFSIVPLLMMKMLNISQEKVNILGGAVAMGHPIGMSGARIVQTLITGLKLKKARYGLASICNGGGGSTAIIVENIMD